MSDILQRLQIVLDQRKLATDEQSYVASLHKSGLNKILKKVGEECTETVLAAKDAALTGDNTQLIYETADLWFHTLVMLSHLGGNVDAVLEELERRMGTSGLAEKAARKEK